MATPRLVLTWLHQKVGPGGRIHVAPVAQQFFNDNLPEARAFLARLVQDRSIEQAPETDGQPSYFQMPLQPATQPERGSAPKPECTLEEAHQAWLALQEQTSWPHMRVALPTGLVGKVDAAGGVNQFLNRCGIQSGKFRKLLAAALPLIRQHAAELDGLVQLDGGSGSSKKDHPLLSVLQGKLKERFSRVKPDLLARFAEHGVLTTADLADRIRAKDNGLLSALEELGFSITPELRHHFLTLMAKGGFDWFQICAELLLFMSVTPVAVPEQPAAPPEEPAQEPGPTDGPGDAKPDSEESEQAQAHTRWAFVCNDQSVQALRSKLGISSAADLIDRLAGFEGDQLADAFKNEEIPPPPRDVLVLIWSNFALFQKFALVLKPVPSPAVEEEGMPRFNQERPDQAVVTSTVPDSALKAYGHLTHGVTWEKFRKKGVRNVVTFAARAAKVGDDILRLCNELGIKPIGRFAKNIQPELAFLRQYAAQLDALSEAELQRAYQLAARIDHRPRHLASARTSQVAPTDKGAAKTLDDIPELELLEICRVLRSKTWQDMDVHGLKVSGLLVLVTKHEGSVIAAFREALPGKTPHGVAVTAVERNLGLLTKYQGILDSVTPVEAKSAFWRVSSRLARRADHPPEAAPPPPTADAGAPVPPPPEEEPAQTGAMVPWDAGISRVMAELDFAKLQGLLAERVRPVIEALKLTHDPDQDQAKSLEAVVQAMDNNLDLRGARAIGEPALLQIGRQVLALRKVVMPGPAADKGKT